MHYHTNSGLLFLWRRFEHFSCIDGSYFLLNLSAHLCQSFFHTFDPSQLVPVSSVMCPVLW